MEGGGGVVAVVSGLRGAGLAVTLVARAHLHSAQPSSEAKSVETSSEVYRTAPSYDVYCASKHQAVHCSPRPSSPPERLTEPPPQRAPMCRNQGTFQTGPAGYNVDGCHYMSSTYCGASQPYRGGWHDRGSLQFGRMSHPVPPRDDPFVHSLRRYPRAPQRSLSAELVQRLLSFTQNKNLGKNPLKSEGAERDTCTKNIQTYTRSKPSRDNGANTSNEIRFNFEKQRKYYAPSDHASRGQREPTRTRRCGRHPEVRYLSDMKRCIRDTIRQICDDHPVVCPQIKSRYTQHKKEHHRSSTDDSNREACQSQATLCCICNRPVPCSCKPGTSSLQTHRPSDVTHAIFPHSQSENKGIVSYKSDDGRESTIEKIILDWIKGIPVYADDSTENKNKREEMVKDLASKLKKLVQDDNYESRAKEHIMNCIENLPMWYPGGNVDREMFKKQIADDLYNRFISIDDKNDDIKDTISQWFADLVFENEMPDKDGIVTSFVNRLKPLLHKPDDMKDEIVKLLQELPILNKRKEINKLADELNNKLTDVMAKKINKTSSVPEYSTDSSDIELEIVNWLEDVPELSIDIKKDMIQNLVETLRKTQALYTNDEEKREKINKEVIDWIDTVLKSNGNKMNAQQKRELSNRLLDKLLENEKFKTENKSWRDDDSLHQTVLSEISELIEDIPSNISKSTKEKIANEIADILTRNFEHLSDKNDNISKEIINILQTYARIPESEATALTSALIFRVKGMPKRSLPADDDIRKYILEEIKDVFHDYDINQTVTEETENEMADSLTDQIIRGTNNDKTKKQLVSILRKANVSNEVSEEISNRLLEISKNFSLSVKTQDSHTVQDRFSRGKSMSPMEKDNFEENAEREVLDFIEDYTGKDSPKTRKKRQVAAEELVHKLGDIMSGPDADKAKSIIEEVSQFLRKLSLDLDISKEEAQKLANRLQNVNFQASTPKKGFAFHPKRDSIDISSINFDDDNNTTKSIYKSKEENEYVAELKTNIQSWLNDLVKDLNVIEDKSLNENIVPGLVGDIIDRKKYLQLNPNTKTSDQEELEYLKYQVFRWLNKLLDIDQLSPLLQKTDVLMNKIKEIDVPQLVKSMEKDAYSNTVKELISEDKGSLCNLISQWMETIPRNLIAPMDKDHKTQMINELVDKIKQLRVNNQAVQIDSEIKNWLSRLLKDAEEEQHSNLTEAGRLKERTSITKESFMLSQDSSQFLEENLAGAINDWLNSLPWYQTRNAIEKLTGQSAVLELVKRLTSGIEAANHSHSPVSEKKIIDEIMQQLYKFPMDIEQKSDTKFIQNLAEQLLNQLQRLQILQNISERRDIPPDDYLTANLENWCSSLPISKINSNEALKFKNVKTELAEKIKQIRKEDFKNEKKLKDEIRSYLKRFPIEENVKNNQEFIDDKVDKLFKDLLWVPIETEQRKDSQNAIERLTSARPDLNTKSITIRELEDETDKFKSNVPLEPNILIDNSTLIKKAADILFDDIENWCDNLHIEEGTPEATERVKKDIARKVLHTVGELNMNPEVFNDDFLYDDLLEDEIDDLLSNIPSEYIKNNRPAIKNDLLEKVKTARHKTREETAGQAYKHRLREAISKTMPTESLTAEERASFEVLKDDLADAFLNLHYTGGDDKLKNTYKTKINDKVSKFCNDYLKKHPASPIDNKQLNQDLYNSLKSVPIPKEETVRNEVELAKVKDEVNEWLKELPLKEQDPAEKIHTNKIISVISKKIHDIEKENELYPNDTTTNDTDAKMRKEITKWVKKLPLNVDDNEINKYTDKLINNLKKTQKLRKVSASTRHSIEPYMFSFTTPSTEQSSSLGASMLGSLPPSSLTDEDREHLQRIKERNTAPRNQLPCCKYALNPLPVDAGSQTEVRPTTGRHFPSEAPGTSERKLSQQSSAIQTQGSPQLKGMQAVGSQAEVSPRVIVKEYYWGSTDAIDIPELCIPCPTKLPTSSHQSRSEEPVPTQPSKCTPCSQCPHIPVTSTPVGSSQLPKTPRKEWEQPCRSGEMPGVFSEDAEPGTSFRCRAKVTRLGSLDDMEPKITKSKEWNFADADFWGDKRVYMSDDDDEPLYKERKREEEKVSCRCRERILTKCSARKRGSGCHTSCQSNDVKRCSRCCGIHCPYPSYLYFRQ